jgi:uncharacterized membrane protein
MSLPEPTPVQSLPEDPRMRRAELIISAVLRIGVVSSMVVILAGTLLSFLHHREYVTSPAELQRLTHPGAAVPQTLHDVGKGVAQLRGRSVVAAGLLLLILTPVIRVAASIVAFVIQRDRIYVLITSLVLLLLLLSFSLGRAIGG